MKNVLLLCMSPVSPIFLKTKYMIENTDVFLEGYMTNEAPTMTVIKKLKEKGERLDKVVLLCTDMVMTKKVEVGKKRSPGVTEETDIRKATLKAIEEAGLKNCSPFERDEDVVFEKNQTGTEVAVLKNYKHIDFYMERVNAYAEKEDSRYGKTPIEYMPVNMPDFMEENEITQAALEAASLVYEASPEEKNIRLYIDFNGGPRSVAFMATAIANLMKVRKVKIQEIMYMNFENKISVGNEKVTLVQNMMPTFESFELVSGINEYIRYGYITGLKEFFKDNKEKGIQINKEIIHILGEMERFANNLQLCRTGKIMAEKGALWKLLGDYVEKYQEIDSGQDANTYELLFLYVIKDIQDGYRQILNGELPDVISWCVERGFVQQALTFCSEEMPKYFWDKQIYYPMELEEKAFRYVMEHAEELGTSKTGSHGAGNKHKKNENKDKKYPQSYYAFKAAQKDPSRCAYAWMITYVPFIEECKDVLEGKTEFEKYHQLLQHKEKIDYIKKFHKDFETIRELNLSRFSTESVNSARSHAAKLCFWNSRNNQRSKTKLTYRKLVGILIIYFLLKEQRNFSNHASNDEKAWSYGTLCEVMTKMAEILGAIK